MVHSFIVFFSSSTTHRANILQAVYALCTVWLFGCTFDASPSGVLLWFFSFLYSNSA
jgi:hypothetical protein